MRSISSVSRPVTRLAAANSTGAFLVSRKPAQYGGRSLSSDATTLAPSSSGPVAPLGVVDTVTGDLVTVVGLTPAAPNALLTFSSGACGVVTELRKGGAAAVAVVSGSPTARESAVVEQRTALFPASLELRGRVVDALGQKIDGLGPVPQGPSPFAAATGAVAIPSLSVDSPSIVERAPLGRCLVTGLKALDSFSPLRVGSSVALMGERGAGKATLALEVITAAAAQERERLAAAARGVDDISSLHSASGGASAATGSFSSASSPSAGPDYSAMTAEEMLAAAGLALPAAPAAPALPASASSGGMRASSPAEPLVPAGPLHIVYCAVGQSVAAINDALLSLRLSGAMEFTTVIAAPAHAHVGMQLLAPQAASAYGLWLARTHGRTVLLVVDSLTRHEVAARRAGSLGWAPVHATASFAGVPALLDRSCQLTAAAGGGSVTSVVLLETVPAVAAAAAASLTADLLAGRKQTGAGSSSSSSSRSGSPAGRDKRNSSDGILSSSSSSSGSSAGSSSGNVAAGAASLTKEGIRQQAFAHHVASLVDCTVDLDRREAGAQGQRAGLASSSAPPPTAGSAASNSHSGSGTPAGAALPIPFSSLPLRWPGHAAQGDAMRHYAARAAVALTQLREAASAAAAARELGLEHEADADAVLDMHAKARALLMPAPGAASANKGGSSGAASPGSFASAAPTDSTGAAADTTATAAGGFAASSSSGGDDYTSKLPEEQRHAMAALLAKRAKERAGRFTSGAAAAAGFAASAGGPSARHADASFTAAVAAASAAADAARAPVQQAAAGAVDHAADGDAGSRGKAPRFRAPTGRAAPAQTFAPIATAVPLFGGLYSAGSGLTAASPLDSDEAAAAHSRLWLSQRVGSAFAHVGHRLAAVAASGSSQSELAASGRAGGGAGDDEDSDSSRPKALLKALDAARAAAAAAVAPGMVAAAGAAAPQHGSPARTLLTLFLIAHGYPQRVPARRLAAYEAGLYALLSALPAPARAAAADEADGADEEDSAASGAISETQAVAASAAASMTAKAAAKTRSAARFEEEEDDEDSFVGAAAAAAPGASTAAAAAAKRAVTKAPPISGQHGSAALSNDCRGYLYTPALLPVKPTVTMDETGAVRTTQSGLSTLSLLDAALLAPIPATSRLAATTHVVDVAGGLRQSTRRLAGAAARGALTQRPAARVSEVDSSNDSSSDALVPMADGSSTDGVKSTQQHAAKKQGFFAWLFAKPSDVAASSPSSSSSIAGGRSAAYLSRPSGQAAGHKDVFASLASPPADSSAAPSSVTAAAGALQLSGDAAAGAATGPTTAAEHEVDPLAPIRGHLRVESSGLRLEELPSVWQAMHVAVAEYTRTFCGEPPLPVTASE